LKNHHTILFIGSFLSSQSGSLSVSEKLNKDLMNLGFETKMVSFYNNRLLRLNDIIFTLLFSKHEFWHIDVYSFNAWYICRIASFLGYVLKKKVVLALHGGALPEFSEKKRKQFMLVFNRAYAIVTPSLMLFKHFSAFGSSITYIPNTLDLKIFHFNRINVKPFSILWVRAFSKIYNPQIAILSFIEIKKIFPQSTLTMIGPDKGELAAILNLIEINGLLDDVHIVGPLPNSSLTEYYHNHHVYINTTSYESFGVSVLEAAACGIPIVSSKVGEIPLLWQENHEILMVENLEICQYVENIISIFNNPDLSNNLSQNARKKSEHYSWVNVRNLWLNIYK